jgi:catechol-2,3-dioxygenase
MTMAPSLKNIDHVHIMVRDRVAAEAWYANTLGFKRITALESWAADGGPLTLADASGQIHLALFEGAPTTARSVVAFGASAAQFEAWRLHLAQALGREPEVVDHQMAKSIYFKDPEGNPYEITTYQVG